MKKHLDSGESYPTARQNALNFFADDCDISLPNNILAVEYLKAIKKLDSKIVPICVNRVGADYNDNFAINNFASATHIRSLIYDGKFFDKFVPENIVNFYNELIKNGQIEDARVYIDNLIRGLD